MSNSIQNYQSNVGANHNIATTEQQHELGSNSPVSKISGQSAYLLLGGKGMPAVPSAAYCDKLISDLKAVGVNSVFISFANIATGLTPAEEAQFGPLADAATAAGMPVNLSIGGQKGVWTPSAQTVSIFEGLVTKYNLSGLDFDIESGMSANLPQDLQQLHSFCAPKGVKMSLTVEASPYNSVGIYDPKTGNIQKGTLSALFFDSQNKPVFNTMFDSLNLMMYGGPQYLVNSDGTPTTYLKEWMESIPNLMPLTSVHIGFGDGTGNGSGMGYPGSGTPGQNAANAYISALKGLSPSYTPADFGKPFWWTWNNTGRYSESTVDSGFDTTMEKDFWTTLNGAGPGPQPTPWHPTSVPTTVAAAKTDLDKLASLNPSNVWIAALDKIVDGLSSGQLDVLQGVAHILEQESGFTSSMSAQTLQDLQMITNTQSGTALTGSGATYASEVLEQLSTNYPAGKLTQTEITALQTASQSLTAGTSVTDVISALTTAWGSGAGLAPITAFLTSAVKPGPTPPGPKPTVPPKTLADAKKDIDYYKTLEPNNRWVIALDALVDSLPAGSSLDVLQGYASLIEKWGMPSGDVKTMIQLLTNTQTGTALTGNGLAYAQSVLKALGTYIPSGTITAADAQVLLGAAGSSDPASYLQTNWTGDQAVLTSLETFVTAAVKPGPTPPWHPASVPTTVAAAKTDMDKLASLNPSNPWIVAIDKMIDSLSSGQLNVFQGFASLMEQEGATSGMSAQTLKDLQIITNTQSGTALTGSGATYASNVLAELKQYIPEGVLTASQLTALGTASQSLAAGTNVKDVISALTASWDGTAGLSQITTFLSSVVPNPKPPGPPTPTVKGSSVYVDISHGFPFWEYKQFPSKYKAAIATWLNTVESKIKGTGINNLALLAPMSSGGSGLDDQYLDLIQTIHSLIPSSSNPNLKITLSIGGANGSSAFDSATAATAQALLSQLCPASGPLINGFDIDYESSANSEGFLTFLQAMHTKLHSEGIPMSLTVMGYPSHSYGNLPNAKIPTNNPPLGIGTSGEKGPLYDVFQNFSEYFDKVNLMLYGGAQVLDSASADPLDPEFCLRNWVSIFKKLNIPLSEMSVGFNQAADYTGGKSQDPSTNGQDAAAMYKKVCSDIGISPSDLAAPFWWPGDSAFTTSGASSWSNAMETAFNSAMQS
ncbi:MAG: hypothetical protein SP1CHLAM54_14420 [Chlamydiia bacterium]|nr:hypothetical protein [Chlamydiia bacterium]MCH9616334.1 hypothetical protein [Chlamydiia bacterium]MCH9629680.1 hypothetical protein [Chlamydiia bacterium]